MVGTRELVRSAERLAVSLGLIGLSMIWLRAHLVALGDMLPLDDAWIHAAFARNLAQNGLWGLQFGARSAGETSPLWPSLLALAELGPLRSAATFALLLGSACFLALIAASSRLGPHGRIASVGVALCGPLLFHATSGMETLPYLLLGTAAIVCYSRDRVVLAGLLAGVAAGVRLDAIVLLAMLWIVECDALRDRGAGWRDAGLAALRALGPGLLLWFGALSFLSAMEGGFPPATLAGRRWLMEQPVSWSWATLGAGSRDFIFGWLSALSAELGFGHFSTHALREIPPLSLVLRHGWKLSMAILLAVGLYRIMLAPARDRWRASERLLLLWALWTVIEYAVLLPSRGHGGRYQAMMYVGLLWTAAAGARELYVGGIWRRRLTWLAAGWVVAGLLAGWWEAGRLRTMAAEHLQRVHGAAVDAWQQREDPALRVAAFDVGLLAYRDSGPWIDISALSDPELAHVIERRKLGAWLRRAGATHVLIPIHDDDGLGSMRDRLGLLETDGVLLEMDSVYESPAELWGDAFQFSGNVLRRLILYRIVALPQ